MFRFTVKPVNPKNIMQIKLKPFFCMTPLAPAAEAVDPCVIGKYLSEFHYDYGGGWITCPNDIFIYQNKIYVLCHFYDSVDQDFEDHGVLIFDMAGNFLSKFGSAGSGDGQFDYPESICVYADKIYIADTDNWRVQSFDLAGNYLGQWGGWGSGDGQFYKVFGLYIYQDKIYTIDTRDAIQGRVQIFDLDGNFISKFGGGYGISDGQFGTYGEIKIYADKIYVSSYNRIAPNNYYRVQVFDLVGNFLYKFAETEILGVVGGIDIFHDVVFLTFWGGEVLYFDLEGNFLGQWGEYGNLSGVWGDPPLTQNVPEGKVYFDNPTGVIVLEDKIFVCDYWNYQVMVFQNCG